MSVRTLLGFDYGERRIGVAVGQSLTATASPLATVAVREGKPDWERIGTLIAEWQPDELVVGLPLNMDGSEQPMTVAARRFARRLGGRHQLTVHLADERLSTREANARIHAGGGARGARIDDDPVAAQVILEGWLAGGQPAGA